MRKFKNWKTTIAGLAGAILVSIQPIAAAIQTNGAVIDYKTLGFAVCIAVLSYFAKDFNVTGTTEEKK